MITRHLVLALTLSLNILGSLALAEDSPQFNVYLTRQVVDNEPAMESDTIFDCSDRIYLVLEALRLPQQKSELLVKWFNPTGDQQERTDFQFMTQPFTRVWAWLQLNGPAGAVIGQVFDPSFGMEDFIGDWEVQVFLDKEAIDTLAFQVVC